ISRAPLRISLGGGGTDLPSYYRAHGGFVISAAIDRYVYITLHETFQREFLIKYSSTEVVQTIDEIKHPIIREALRLAPAAPPLPLPRPPAPTPSPPDLPRRPRPRPPRHFPRRPPPRPPSPQQGLRPPPDPRRTGQPHRDRPPQRTRRQTGSVHRLLRRHHRL